MIYRIYPSKDAFITNDLRKSVRMTGANVGASEELVVFKKSGLSGTIGSLGSSSLCRSLLQFDFSEYLYLISTGFFSSGSTYVLRMNHKTSADPLPTSYDMKVFPVSSSWDEGRGLDVVGLADPGTVNWTKRTQAAYWTTAGGDLLTTPTSSFHFDDGTEDLEVDVTSIVVAWLTGNLANNGVAVALTSSLESDLVYSDYYTKKFYSRQSSYEDRRPYIEARGDDFVHDDRQNMRWGITGTLYLYNVVGGRLQNLQAGNVYVTIADLSGNLKFLTASLGAVGVYSASFALATGSYSGSIFYDRWGSGSHSFMTSSFSFSQEGPVAQVDVSPLVSRVRNLRADYDPEEQVRFEVLFKRAPRSLGVLRSTASLSQVPYIVESGFYAIENDATRERVVPFGTGTLQHTRLSYAANGNYFDFSMKNLHQGNVYRVLFLVDDGGRRQVIDDGIKFKIL